MWLVLFPFSSLCENETFLLFFPSLVCVANHLAVAIILFSGCFLLLFVWVFVCWLVLFLLFGVFVLFCLFVEYTGFHCFVKTAYSYCDKEWCYLKWLLCWLHCGFGCVKVTSQLGSSKNSPSPLHVLMKYAEGFPWQITFVNCRGTRTKRKSRSSWVTWTSWTARPPGINGTYGPISRYIPH